MPINKITRGVLPSKDRLRVHLIAVWDSTRPRLGCYELPALPEQAVRDAVMVARLSSRACWFCGVATAPQRSPTAHVDWESHELCGCLESYRPKERWHLHVSTGVGLLEVVRQVDAGTLAPKKLVLERPCRGHKLKHGRREPCTAVFKYTAGSLAHAVRNFVQTRGESGLSNFDWPTRCRSCRETARRKAGNTRADKAAPLEKQPNYAPPQKQASGGRR